MRSYLFIAAPWISLFLLNQQVSLARGHPRSATSNYKKTLKVTDFDEAEYHDGLNLPNARFSLRNVEQLILVLCKEIYRVPRIHNTIEVEEMSDEH